MIKESEFTYLRKPPEKRISACFDEHEQVIPEGSVMLACALHFFQTGADHVSIHPDGMHLKDINIKMWLKKIGFDKLTQIGQTEAGGLYSKRSKKLEVNPKSGVGDVVAFFGDHKVIIEAKGGVLNTRHSGQVSKVRRGFYEALGILLLAETNPADKKIIAVPHTKQPRTGPFHQPPIPAAKPFAPPT